MSPPLPSPVLVAGATGGVGLRVVERLRDRGAAVRILTRDGGRAAARGGVDVVEGDALVAPDAASAVEGCAAVVCTLGERRVPRGRPIVDGDGVIHLAEAAAAAGARRFVLVSSLGVGDSWGPLPFPVKWMFHALRVMPILEEKARSERHLEDLDIDWTVLRPGWLTDRALRREPLVTAGSAGGTTARRAVADVAVRCLRSPASVGRTLAVVDGAMRFTLSGEGAFALDDPWEPWSG